MTVHVHRPDSPTKAPAPTLGSVGYLHDASGGQLGCLIGIIGFLVLLLLLRLGGDSASKSSDSNESLVLVAFGAVAAIVFFARYRDRSKIAVHGPITLVVRADPEDERRLKQLIADYARFKRMVRQAGLAEESAREVSDVGWAVWHAGERINRIGELSREIHAAGHRVTGPAKAEWLGDRMAAIRVLGAPVDKTAKRLARLADLAEDVTYAARLAQDQGLEPGRLYYTLDLDMPHGGDIVASDAIEASSDRLHAWHQTWAELNDGLRAAAAIARKKNRRAP